MGAIRAIQTNFTSGALDPLMKFRVDTSAWANGAAEIVNGSLFNTGGVGRRPGTYIQNGGLALAGPTRLVTFEVSGRERYVFGFQANALRVWDMTGALVASYNTVGRWTASSLFEFTYAQVADTMVVAHVDWPQQVIKRTAANVFTVADIALTASADGKYIYQPYYKFADDSVTITASASTGSVTITASAPVFTPAMVGQHIMWQQTEIVITGYTDPSHVTGTVLGELAVQLDVNPFHTTQGTPIIEVTHVFHGFATGNVVTFKGSSSVGGFDAGYINNHPFTITVTDQHHYTFDETGWGGTSATATTDGGGAHVTVSSASLQTRDWAVPAWSAISGYPGAVAFHEGRLWFGGSLGQPDGIWASKTFEYFNFDVGEGIDSDSIQVTVGSDDISNVRHLISHRDLQIFSTTSELYAPSPPTGALTPATIKIKRQTPYGSSMVTPQLLDGATLFLQATRSALREYIYAYQTDGYAATDLTLLAGNLIHQPVDLAVLYGSVTRSEQYAFLVNSDGSMAVFNSARSENLAGWTLWQQNGGAFRSVATVGTDVFFVVQRGASYYLERLATDRLQTLDGASHVSGAPATDWNVGALYAGKSVDVVSGPYWLGTLPVDGTGLVHLPVPVTDLWVGYGYPFRIRTLPVHIQIPQGPLTGRPKRISRVIIGLDTTLSVSVTGNRLNLFSVNDDFSVPPLPFTGTKEFFLLGYARDADVLIDQEAPLASTVLGLVSEVQI